MQAIILAAGMGKRLGQYTKGNTKCMLEVNGTKLIDRTLQSLSEVGVRRVVMVVGYKGQNVKDYLGTNRCGIPITYIDNPVYDRTNNIYSLFLMKDIFARLVMVNESDAPSDEMIDKFQGFANTGVGRGTAQDWYCLLRELQGELNKLKAIDGEIPMIDKHDFIKDSLFCECAYIIDLDEEVLEFWIGFQQKPWEDNPYGTECEDGYYPCRRYATFSLGADATDVVDKMNYICDHQEEFENRDEGFPDYQKQIENAVSTTDWSTRFLGEYIVEFEAHSPEGEDLRLGFCFRDMEDLYEQLCDLYDDFDCDTHVYETLQCCSSRNLPSIRALCDDAEEIEKMYLDLCNAIRDIL